MLQQKLFLIAMVSCLVLVMTLTVAATAQSQPEDPSTLRVLSFNILQGGADASNVGFPNGDFGGSRYDELAGVIRVSQADVIGIQEDDRSGRLLQELGEDWFREGSIYSRYQLTLMHHSEWTTIARVELSSTDSIVIVNCHWSPENYGPFIVQKEIQDNGAPEDLGDFEERILDLSFKRSDERGYQQTLDMIEPLLAASETIVVTGDFNEPSHLDWTVDAAKEGLDRWVTNPTNTPLRFPIRWTGSLRLADAGLKDAYREFLPDEVMYPGNTWTPTYPESTTGRRPYGDQVLDRIDMIYYAGPGIQIKSAGVVGESEETAEIVFDGTWPSDHRAVLAVFEISP